MEKSFIFLRIISYVLFVIFVTVGLFYILASPVIPALTISRLVTGISLIILGLIILVIISILIQRKQQVIHERTYSLNKSYQEQDEIPTIIICKECNSSIEIPDDYRGKKRIICENCGTENLIPKSKVKW